MAVAAAPLLRWRQRVGQVPGVGALPGAGVLRGPVPFAVDFPPCALRAHGGAAC